MSELSQRKKPKSGESGDGYTPILPEDWKLSGLDAAPPPQELGGPVGKVIKSTSAVFSKLDKGVRREADRRLVSSLRFLLKKIGVPSLPRNPCGRSRRPHRPRRPCAQAPLC